MALDSIPPWISVQPTDFLHAVQAGGAAGLGIAEAQNRAREAAARTAEAQRAAAQQQWEFGEKMRIAAEENASKDELTRAQMAQQHEYQTGMLGYHNRSLDDAMARAGMQNEAKGNLLDLRSQHYNDLLDWRNRELSLREEAAKNKMNPTDYQTSSTEIPASEAIPGTPEIPESGTIGGLHIPFLYKPGIPATPATPARFKETITRRIPIGGRSLAAPEAPPEPLPSDYQEGVPIAPSPNMGSLLDTQPGVDQSWMSRPLSSVVPTEPTAGVVATYDPKTKKFTSTASERVVPESALKPSQFLTGEIPTTPVPPTVSESIPTPIASVSGPILGEKEIRDLYKVARLSKSQANDMLQAKKDRAAGHGKIYNFEPIDGPEWSSGRESSLTNFGKHWNPVTHKWESEFE